MHVSKLGDRVPKGVIEVTRGHVAAVNVSDQPPGDGGGRRAGERFNAVTQHDHELRVQSGEGLGQSADAAAQSDGLMVGVVLLTLHAHGRVDGPAVAPPHPAALSFERTVGQQVHTRGDKPQAEPRVRVDGSQDGAQNAIFGTRAGDNRDGPPCSGWHELPPAPESGPGVRSENHRGSGWYRQAIRQGIPGIAGSARGGPFVRG